MYTVNSPYSSRCELGDRIKFLFMYILFYVTFDRLHIVSIIGVEYACLYLYRQRSISSRTDKSSQSIKNFCPINLKKFQCILHLVRVIEKNFKNEFWSMWA